MQDKVIDDLDVPIFKLVFLVSYEQSNLVLNKKVEL
jgi:hypothetical protein